MRKLLSYTELVNRRSRIDALNSDLEQVSKAMDRRIRIIGNAMLTIFPELGKHDIDEIRAFANEFRSYVMHCDAYRGSFVGFSRDEVFEAFWNRVEPTFVNDLIPVTMLFDCYTQFCNVHDVSEKLRIRRNQFFKYVKTFVESNCSEYVVPTDSGSDVRGISLAPNSWIIADEPMVLEALATVGKDDWATKDPQVEKLARWLPPFVKRDLFKPRGGIFRKDRYNWCKANGVTPREVILLLDAVVIPEAPDFDDFLEVRQEQAMFDYHRDVAEHIAQGLDAYKTYVDAQIGAE